MKNNFTKFLSVLAMTFILHCTAVNAQSVADFENNALPQTDTFWNGISNPLGTTFTSADAIFPNNYDTAWGGYWSAGWAYSNMTDTTNGTSSNLYAARPGTGYGGSANYATGQQNAWINLSNNAIGKVVDGFYISNSTYSARVIENGNSFSRKFGDTTGTGHSGPQGSYPDYFLLTVYGYYNGAQIADSVDFYLADFRGADSTDYIVEDWQWVDLKILGNVDSLRFQMRSSDEGSFGINTPLFFCIDDFTTANVAVATADISSKKSIELYPNPVKDQVTISLADIEASSLDLVVYNFSGQAVYTKHITNQGQEQDVNLSSLSSGTYLVQLKSTEAVWTTKLIKQ